MSSGTTVTNDKTRPRGEEERPPAAASEVAQRLRTTSPPQKCGSADDREQRRHGRGRPRGVRRAPSLQTRPWDGAASADAAGHHFRDYVINSIFTYTHKDQEPVKPLYSLSTEQKRPFRAVLTVLSSTMDGLSTHRSEPYTAANRTCPSSVGTRLD